jgi:hypothetical protein
VQRLVDQAHGIERPRMHRALGMACCVSRQIDAVGELTAGGKIREDDIPSQREQGIRKAVTLPRPP